MKVVLGRCKLREVSDETDFDVLRCLRVDRRYS